MPFNGCGRGLDGRTGTASAIEPQSSQAGRTPDGWSWRGGGDGRGTGLPYLDLPSAGGMQGCGCIFFVGGNTWASEVWAGKQTRPDERFRRRRLGRHWTVVGPRLVGSDQRLCLGFQSKEGIYTALDLGAGGPPSNASIAITVEFRIFPFSVNVSQLACQRIQQIKKKQTVRGNLPQW